MTPSDLVVVRTFLNRFEADVAKSALDAADIESLVRADDAGGMRPGMSMGEPVALLVRADDAGRAARFSPPRPLLGQSRVDDVVVWSRVQSVRSVIVDPMRLVAARRAHGRDRALIRARLYDSFGDRQSRDRPCT